MAEADRDGDDARAAALAALRVLDTPEEQAFDDLVFIAARLCDAPIALVSLLDRDRQWFKARAGLDVCETGIDQSVCRIEIDRAELLEITDLTADPRTRDNPLVTGERGFRFYAGAPLVLRTGVVIGRLCVIDVVPRPDGLSSQQKALLGALARQVGDHLELRRITKTSERLAELQTALVEVGERIRGSADTDAMTRAAAAVVGRVLRADRAGFGTVDADVRHVDIGADWTATGVASIAGRHRFEDFGDLREQLVAGEPLVIDDVRLDPRTAADPRPMLDIGIGALVNMPVREHARTIALFLVHSTGPRAWSPEELAFLRAVADRLEAGVARHRSEQQQQVLNGEISHRLKNMLTMVQAIASHTLRSVADRDAVESFERRLLALSAAHDVLLQRSWASADLHEVAAAVLETVGFADRVRMAGPMIPLGPRAALSFSLIVHELLTNACKYGALCGGGGCVELGWTVPERDGGDGELEVRWRERGGPAVTAPTRRGFGSRLVRAGLVGTGGVDLRYEPDGFEADLRASLRELAQA